MGLNNSTVNILKYMYLKVLEQLRVLHTFLWEKLCIVAQTSKLLKGAKKEKR